MFDSREQLKKIVSSKQYSSPFLDKYPEGYTVLKGGFLSIIEPCTKWLFPKVGMNADETSNYTSWVQFSNRLNEERELSVNYLADLVDEFRESKTFKDVIFGPVMKKSAADLLSCSEDDVVISHPMFRLDMHNDSKEEQVR